MTDVNGSAPAGNPEGNAAPSGTPEWLGKLDEGTRGVLTTKGWADPDPVAALNKVVGSYSGLEKLLGHDRAGRTVVLPGEKATPEETRAFLTKIGVPETADGYKFEVGEGADQNLVGWFKQAAHKHGIPANAASGLVKEWEGFARAAQKQAEEADQAEKVKAFEEWKGKLGNGFDEHVGNAKRAMAALGIDAEKANEIDALFGAMGLPGLGGVDLLAKLAVDYGIGKESDLKGGGGASLTPASPEAAKAALKAFEASEEWLKVAFDKNAANRQAIIEKRNKLYAQAYPDQGEGFTVMGRVS